MIGVIQQGHEQTERGQGQHPVADHGAVDGGKEAAIFAADNGHTYLLLRTGYHAAHRRSSQSNAVFDRAETPDPRAFSAFLREKFTIRSSAARENDLSFAAKA